MSSRHVKSSFILVNFMIRDNKVNCYTGQVQYFFKHILVLMMMRKLVMSNYGKRILFLWSRQLDSIIPVQNILCRFVPVKCKISNRQDAIEYLAINSINRKFHIR